MQPVAEKLAKLIAHEQSARQIGNMQEAEAFAAKIAELMFRHNLSMTDIEIKQQEIAEPIAREQFAGKRGRSLWMDILAGAVARASFCRHLVVQGTSTQIFVGRTSDRQAAMAFYRHILGVATSMVNQYKRNLRDNNPYYDNYQRAIFSRNSGKDFLYGFATAIQKRLDAQHQQLAAESQNATALVVRKDHALQQFMDQQKNIRTGKTRRVTLHSENAYAAGQRAGNSINLSTRAALNG